MKINKKQKIIKLISISVILWVLIFQYIYWPKHPESEVWFPKKIFNALKNI